VAVRVDWLGVEWYLDAYDFGHVAWWREGTVFLFPAKIGN
jgi:hypothetical protein